MIKSILFSSYLAFFINNGVAQKEPTELKGLVYSNDFLNASDLFILEDDLLLINTVQDADNKLFTVLLNKSNILKDTIFPGLLVYQIYKDAEVKGRYHLFGNLNYYHFDIVEDKIRLPENEISKDFNPGYFTTVFEDKLIVCKQNRDGTKVIAFDRDKEGHYSKSSKSVLLYENNRKVNLKKRFISQLPFSFGSDDNLYIFVRDEQKLIKIAKDFELDETVINTSGNKVFSYFYDASSSRHFFVEKSKSDSYRSYEYNTAKNNLRFLSEIEHHPIAIYDYHYYFCSGFRKSNCDFYKKPLFSTDDKSEINLLEDITIEEKHE